MRHICFLILLTFFGPALRAQFNGRKFISGSSNLSFYHSSSDESIGSGENFNVAVSLGKFRSEIKGTGWQLMNSFGHGSSTYVNDINYPDRIQKSFNSQQSFGIGRFWQFYKHFNDRLGIYAGLDANLKYVHYVEQWTDLIDEYHKSKRNVLSLYTGLNAGIYYKFSERWFITGSFSVNQPISIDYSSGSYHMNNPDSFKERGLTYKISPNLGLPAIGFGLRYFF